MNGPARDAERLERRRIARRKARPLILAILAVPGIPFLLYLAFFVYPGLLPWDRPLIAGGVVALLILAWLGAVLTVLFDGFALMTTRRAQRHAVCPHCGIREAPPMVSFGHQLVAGTGWEELTCPYCRQAWHLRV
ncbi:MAG TPA: hypothetical protein VM536_09320 [Chloroflexia bacterium]|nr:hypothetical protein [Chloroflexia bacterium]